MDLTGDGIPDLVVANYDDNTVSVLLSNGDGTFGAPQPYNTGNQPVQTLVTDINGDGRPDLVTVSNSTSQIGVQLNIGADSFVTASQATAVGQSNTPFLVDLTGDGLLDSVIVDGSGDILYRRALPGASNTFAPPVILNPGAPARAIAIIDTANGYAIAAAGSLPDPAL